MPRNTRGASTSHWLGCKGELTCFRLHISWGWLELLQELCDWFTSNEYRKHVLAKTSFMPAFDISRSTKYIVDNTKVYHKSIQKGAKMTREQYNQLMAWGLVTAKQQAIANMASLSICTPVYICKWRLNNRKHKYCYTVIKGVPQQVDSRIAEVVPRFVRDIWSIWWESHSATYCFRFNPNGQFSKKYTKKALTPSFNTSHTGMSSFYYFLTSSKAASEWLGRLLGGTGGQRGQPNKHSLPQYVTFGQKQHLINGKVKPQQL